MELQSKECHIINRHIRQCKLHVMFSMRQESEDFRSFIFFKINYVIPLDLINCYKNNNNFEKILANPSYVTKMTFRGIQLFNRKSCHSGTP